MPPTPLPAEEQVDTAKNTMHQMLRRFGWSVPDDYYPQLTWGTGPRPAEDLPRTVRALVRR